MTLVDLAALNAMRAERDAALAENARLRAAVDLVVQDIRAQRGDHVAGLVEDSFGAHFDRAAALAAPTANDGAERGAR